MTADNENNGDAAAEARSHTLPSGPVGLEEPANLAFPIVGIGASAGGMSSLLSVCVPNARGMGEGDESPPAKP